MPHVSGTVNPLVEPGWDAMVAAHPAGSFFHTTPWARVLVESYGYRPVYFTVVENGALQALLPAMEVDSVSDRQARGIPALFGLRRAVLPRMKSSTGSLAKRAVEYGKAVQVGRRWKYGEGECPWAEGRCHPAFLGHRLSLSGIGNRDPPTDSGRT